MRKTSQETSALQPRGRISDMKDDYQDVIEEFIDKYENTIQNRSALNLWQEEVIAVGEEVKAHADRVRSRAAFIQTPRASAI